jgi:PhnB protein
MRLTTYLNYGGNCQEAFKFYEQHLDGRITMMMTFGQLPEGNPPAPDWSDKVLHARITIADVEISGADVPPDRFQPMRSAYLALSVDTSEDAVRIYTLLTEGGQVFMPIAETFFAYEFAMFRDRFGTSWMLLHEKPMER